MGRVSGRSQATGLVTARWRAARLAIVCVIGALGVGCGPSDTPPTERLAVRNGWARIADSGATSGAYLELVNRDTVAVSVIGISTEVATAAEVHETKQHDGMVHMMPRTALVIPAGGTVSMAPGGLHVMLVGLRRGLSAGDSVPLRIHFSDSTQIRVVVPVHTP